MWRVALLALIISLGSLSSRGVAMNTALQALRFLSAEEMQRIAKIAGCEGRPTPERWHVVLYDAQAENGLRDYVITNQQIVSRNLVSQFASAVTQEQVIGQEVKVDSDRAALVARRLAASKHVPVYALNYELRRDVLGGGPVWKVTCLDEKGADAGWVVIDASTATVVARGGFSTDPDTSTQAGAPVAVQKNATAGQKTAAARPSRSAGGFHPENADSAPGGTSDDLEPIGEKPSQGSRTKSAERPTSRSRSVQSRRGAPEDQIEEGRRIVTQPIRIVRGILSF